MSDLEVAPIGMDVGLTEVNTGRAKPERCE